MPAAEDLDLHARQAGERAPGSEVRTRRRGYRPREDAQYSGGGGHRLARNSGSTSKPGRSRSCRSGRSFRRTNAGCAERSTATGGTLERADHTQTSGPRGCSVAGNARPVNATRIEHGQVQCRSIEPLDVYHESDPRAERSALKPVMPRTLRPESFGNDQQRFP